MLRFVSFLLLLLGIFVLTTLGARADDRPGAGAAERPGARIALVIGNSAYLHASPLANPGNDATAMGRLFKSAGFDTVDVRRDLGVNEFRHALADFEELAQDADVAVIYYSGHGIEFNGKNYLVPTDAAIRRAVDVQDETVPLDRVLDGLAGTKKLKLVILDACRSDPFKATSLKKAIDRGLARVEPSEADELIGYAARAGTVAADGDAGGNSPYTKALLNRLATPGLDVELALRRVRDDVLAVTHREQEPDYYGRMGGTEIPLVAKPAAEVQAAVTPNKPQAAPAPTVPIAPAPAAALPPVSASSAQTRYIMPEGAAIVPRDMEGTHRILSVAFSRDGQTALTGSNDHTLKLWDLATGKLIKSFEGHSDAVTSVAFSPDGRTALSGSDDDNLMLWDVATGNPIRTFVGHTDGVRSVAFSPDGRTVLSGSWEAQSRSQTETLKLWDVATGNPIRTFGGNMDGVFSVAFSPDGRTALSGGEDSTLKFWNVATGHTIGMFVRHTDWVRSVAFSPDGRTILSGSRDKTLNLSDVTTGQTIRYFIGHGNEVTSVAYSPDGRTALSGSFDDNLMLWDVATGQPIRTLTGHSDSGNCSPPPRSEGLDAVN